MPLVSTIKMEIRFVDTPYPGRKRWNGDPLPSAAASDALEAAADAAQAAVAEHGFHVVGRCYGVTAKDYT